MPPNEYLFLRPNTDFQHFGNQHFEMMALTLVLAIGLAIFAKWKLTVAQQVQLSRAMTLVMALAVVAHFGINLPARLQLRLLHRQAA